MADVTPESVFKRAHDLWQRAHSRDFDRVALRIDPGSLRALEFHARLNNRWDEFERSGGGGTWRRLKIIAEMHMPPAAYGPSEISAGDVIEEAMILTIECKDRRSGRVVYISDENNPPGYA
jgi:hypothetical protein